MQANMFSSKRIANLLTWKTSHRSSPLSWEPSLAFHLQFKNGEMTLNNIIAIMKADRIITARGEEVNPHRGCRFVALWERVKIRI